MVFESILIDIEDGILTITLNRPQALNALNKRTFIELATVFEDVPLNETIQGVIITGMGDKAFAAGADIKEFMDFDVEQGKHLARNGHEVFFMIERCPKPVIAAVNGFALGGGCELSMACHMRVASTNARFGQPEVNLGLTPGYAGTQRLVQLIGKGKAMELLMTADAIKADEALQLGLVNYVLDQDKLHGFCFELLKKIATKSPVAIAGVIECVNACFQEGVDGFDKEVEVFGNCFGTDDFKKGTDAFINKRKAEFTGK